MRVEAVAEARAGNHRDGDGGDATGGTSRGVDRGALFRVLMLVLGVVLVAASSWGSLFVGAGDVPPHEVVSAVTPPYSVGTENETVILDMRVPRILTALLVGAALGIAGAVMQALIGNPLADPGLLGVNAGAGLAVVIAVGALGLVTFDRYVPFALLGALLVSLFVYAVSLTVGRGSPFTIVLSGVALTAVLTGVSSALAVVDPARFNALRGWMSGTVAGRELGTVGQGGIVILLGVVVTVLIARPLAQLGLGEDTARALGVRLGLTRLGAAIAVMLLAGGATALGGPIMFVGLMVPHLARLLAGQRIGWVLAYSALAGAILLLVADTVGRVLVPPGEAPAGLLTAIIGAPVLAALARGRREEDR